MGQPLGFTTSCLWTKQSTRLHTCIPGTRQNTLNPLQELFNNTFWELKIICHYFCSSWCLHINYAVTCRVFNMAILISQVDSCWGNVLGKMHFMHLIFYTIPFESVISTGTGFLSALEKCEFSVLLEFSIFLFCS